MGAELLNLPSARVGTGTEFRVATQVEQLEGQVESGGHAFSRAQSGLLQALHEQLPVRQRLHLLRQGVPKATRVRLQGRVISARL